MNTSEPTYCWPTSCCQCGVPFDLNPDNPISHVLKPKGKATCFDCMKCEVCQFSLTKLQNNKTVWIWFDSGTYGLLNGGFKCLNCLVKKAPPDSTEPKKEKKGWDWTPIMAVIGLSTCLLVGVGVWIWEINHFK
jgi:hypothetical protein